MADQERKEEKRLKALVSSLEGKAEEYGMTKRTLYSAFGILGCFALTVVMSITGIGFDSSLFLTWNYWVGMIVQFAIAIFAMITGQHIGDDIRRNKPTSQFRRCLGEYSKQRKRIDDLNVFEHFEAWLEIYRSKKIERKIRETLQDFGIKQPEVLDLDLTELDNLNNPWEKDWKNTVHCEKYLNAETGESKTVFKSLSKEQIEALRKILTGAVTVSNVSASYFMNALKNTASDEWERASRAEAKKGGRLVTGYSYRLLAILLFSFVVNGLIAVPYESAGAVALNIATRIFVLLSSAIWGIYLGFKIVEMDIVFLSYKTDILKLYADEVENGTFKIDSIEEQAKEEYERFKEKKNEEGE